MQHRGIYEETSFQLILNNMVLMQCFVLWLQKERMLCFVRMNSFWLATPRQSTVFWVLFASLLSRWSIARPEWGIYVKCLSQGHNDALSVLESIQESAIFWSLARRSTTETSPQEQILAAYNDAISRTKTHTSVGLKYEWLVGIESNQSFHCSSCITPKCVTSLRGRTPRHCPRATQLLSKKCRRGDEPVATLSSIWPAWDLSLRPPAPETNALPLDQYVN